MLMLMALRVASNVIDDFIPYKIYWTFRYYPFFVTGMLLYLVRTAFVTGINYRLVVLLTLGYLVTKWLLIQGLDIPYILETYALVPLNNTMLALAIIFLLSLIVKPSITLTKLVSSSYTIYLLHQPFVVMLFYVINPLSLNHYVSFLLICVITLAISYWLHTVIAKSRILLFLFNGKVGRAAPKADSTGVCPTASG